MHSDNSKLKNSKQQQKNWLIIFKTVKAMKVREIEKLFQTGEH